jgi:hypothetical protein
LSRVFKSGFGVFSNSKWGFIDTSGTLIIQDQFYRAGNFSEGLAWVEKKEQFLFFVLSDTYGFIDKSGEVVIPYQFDRAGNFSEGLANNVRKSRRN